MKALVVYEGNTEKVAQAICAGMKQAGQSDVVCMAVGRASPAELAKAEYWVLGGPSYGFLAGRKITGLLNKSVASGGKSVGVLFDTRMAGETSGTSEKLASIMKNHNMMVASWTYFSLGPDKVLLDGEEALANTFGKNLVEMMK
jgi:flavorubredoxin